MSPYSMSPYSTPNELVGAVLEGNTDAREQFEEMFRDPIARLIEELIKRQRIEDEPERLTDFTLSWAQMYLRSQDCSKFEGISRERFRASVLWPVIRMLREPTNNASRTDPPPEFHPDCPDYGIDTLFRPHQHVGGDWFAGEQMRDGSFWLIVCDVTGKGDAAYRLASGLKYLWKYSPIENLRNNGCQPHELLAALGEELSRCLPFGIFVEATVARFAPSGEVVVAGAGACRLLLRPSQDEPVRLHKLGGPFLGLNLPGQHDQRTLRLRRGSELLMASDGLFDQPCAENVRLVKILSKLTVDSSSSTTLHNAVVKVLNAASSEYPQHDDTTVVTVCFNPGTFTDSGCIDDPTA